MGETVRGAEATLEFKDDKVVKTREPKKYRHTEIDARIVEERTEREYRVLKDARSAGAEVPEVEKTGENVLELENIRGETLRESLEDRIEAVRELGENVAKLHSADIIHGDLTTSNVLVSGGEPVIIDFGLAFRSQRTEDRAVDLHLFKQVLESSHPDHASEAWNSFIEGYSRYGNSGEVLERLEEVESRGRYK